MKKLFLLFLVFGLSLPLLAQFEDNLEYIKNFKVMLKLDTSGLVEVTEQITVNATGDQIKRGIVRVLPTTRTTADNKWVKTPIDIKAIQMDGSKSDYHTETNGSDLSIYIGSKDVMVSPGLHQYEIVYTTKNQVGFFKDYDEIYWNVTGNKWDFPIMQANCQVFLPPNAKILQKACYTGIAGAKEYNCHLDMESDAYINFASGNLNQNEGLTVAVGFSKNVISPPPPPTFWEIWRIRIVSLLTLLGMFGYYLFTWTKYGIDPPKPVVYPQFTPPNGLSIGSLGMIDSEKFNSRIVSATFIYWAVNGFIKIKDETESYLFNLIKSPKYILSKLKEADSSFSAEEKILFHKIFSGKDDFTIDGKYNETLYNGTQDFKSKLESNFDSSLGKGKNTMYIVMASLVFIAISIYLVINGGTTNLFIVLIPLFGFMIFIPLLFKLFKWFTDKWNARTYSDIIIWLILIPATLMVALAWTFAKTVDEKTLFSFLIIGIASLVLYAYLIRRPEVEKLKLQSEIDGFKMYMKMAEDERVKLLNPPNETPQLFEKYLPYAILFKVEKVWGERFKNLLIKEPNQNATTALWYSGNNFSQFTDNISSSGFRSALDNSSGQSPNYSSGSGGGGFSGGGGGGGGGGGW